MPDTSAATRVQASTASGSSGSVRFVAQSSPQSRSPTYTGTLTALRWP